MKKRIGIMVLSLILAVTLSPAVVFAENGMEAGEPVPENAVPAVSEEVVIEEAAIEEDNLFSEEAPLSEEVFLAEDAEEWQEEPSELLNETDASGKCGTNVTWSLSGGVLTISGSGRMYDYALNYMPFGTTTPWNSEKNSIRKVVVEKSVTYIGSHAFMWCQNMTSASLPETVTEIGDCAFENCTSLQTISLPSKLKTVEMYAFFGCASLKTVNYQGTAAQWKKISIGNQNDPLKNATVKYAEKLTGLSIGGSRTITAGKSVTLKPVYTPSDTKLKGVTWKSSNKAVASVNSKGKVTGKKYGTVTITATSKANSGIKAKCRVKIDFKDVTQALVGNGYYKAVCWAADNKITASAASFGFKDSMTRGQFVRFLYRYAGEPKITGAMIKKYGSAFADVDKDYTHYEAIIWAVSKGLIDGYKVKGKQVFKPGQSLSRKNVATILWKFAGSPKVSNVKKPFSDVSKSVAIAWGKNKKIFTGTKFYPTQNCLRGDFALYLYRYDRL